MARHLNRCSLIGNLGKDLKQGSFSNGTPYASFSVATTESYQDQEGNWQDNTQWHNVVAFGRLADVITKQFATGSLVFVEGQTRTRTIPASGQYPERSITEVVCKEWSLLREPKPRSQAAAPPPMDPPPARAPASAATQRSRTSNPRASAHSPSAPPPSNLGEEDIPFHELDPSI